MSVVFSSHVISELERVADYLVVLSAGRVQMAGPIDDLLTRHQLLSGPAEQAGRISGLFPVVQAREAGRHAELLVRAAEPAFPPSGWRYPASPSKSSSSPTCGIRRSPCRQSRGRCRPMPAAS
jgi:ABC-2 type transport system ATP-binding protein